jgi:predicted DNA-binding transcriptional regulator AlpA
MCEITNSKQFAKRLGVHKDTLRKMKDDHRLPPTCSLSIPGRGGLFRWLTSDIDAWFDLRMPDELTFCKLMSKRGGLPKGRATRRAARG